MKYPFLDLRKLNEPLMPELEEAACRVIRSGRYIGGEEVEAFNTELAALLGADYAVGVSNGLDALRLIIRAYIELGRLAPDDEIIVPANTYIASVLAISDNRLRPILVDPDPVTMNLSADAVEKALSSRTRAIMPVHLYGRVAWDDPMRRLVEDHGLIVIEDSAQAIGAVSTAQGLFSSRHAGSIGHAGALSFYPTKNVGALGDAGAVITSDPQLAQAVNALANYGSISRYHNIYQGYNCRIDPIQAAMLRVKLRHIDAENSARRQRAALYSRLISNPSVTVPATPLAPDEHVWHQYVVRVPAPSRDAFRESLAQSGVGTDIHYATPPHRQPCYRDLDHRPLPVTEMLADSVVSLPITSATPLEHIESIARIINDTTL